jgi:hypothetical protein
MSNDDEPVTLKTIQKLSASFRHYFLNWF